MRGIKFFGILRFKGSPDPGQDIKPIDNFLKRGNLLNRGPQSEKQRKRKKRQVLRPCQRTEKAVKHEDDGDINCHWDALNIP